MGDLVHSNVPMAVWNFLSFLLLPALVQAFSPSQLTFTTSGSQFSAFNPVLVAFHPLRAAPAPGISMVNVGISVGEGESIESALRRFKKEVNKSGHLIEMRHRRYFESSVEKRIRKEEERIRRKRRGH